MKTYKQFVDEDTLQEKLIVINDGKKYGQIIFLIGGTASGKGFALDNFLDRTKFKVRDVDAWKESFIKLQKRFDAIKQMPACEIGSDGKPIRTGECNPYGVLRGINLRNPGDVFKIHEFVKDLGVREKTLELMLSSASPDHLPNIIFDITGKRKDMKRYIQDLMAVGYLPENIHLIWVLTNYYDAVERNKSRSRVVPDDVILASHESTANVMNNILNGDTIENLDGSYYIILNNTENTKYYPNSKVVQDFKYMKIKDSGSPMNLDSNQIGKINSWMTSNIPKTANTADIFDQVYSVSR